MRLIDADALSFGFTLTDDLAGVLKQIGVEMVKSRVDNAPTIDPESLRPKGEWIKRGQEIYCSECGEESGYTWAGASRFSDFCPNRGAKMNVTDINVGNKTEG